MKYKLFGPTEFLVQINYKSGTSMRVWCTSFNTKRGTVGLQGVEWKAVRAQDQIMFLGIDDVESIYQVDARKALFGGTK